MPAIDLRPVPFDGLTPAPAPGPDRWLWHGYLRPGDVTLLTSQWKTGKTTLLTGLVRQLGVGGHFLGRPVREGRVWVVSEESAELWAERVRHRPVGPHADLLARPFRGRPSAADWESFIDQAAEAAAGGGLDLLVLDPLASFLPGRCESDAASLLEALHPLHRLTARGAAVLLLHHPRKKAAEAGSTARGSGALLGFVDVTVELTRYSTLKSDANRRLLSAQSRRPDTPARLAYEYDPGPADFRAVEDPRHRQFLDNWAVVEKVLAGCKGPLTCGEIYRAWPADVDRPSESTLYHWLNLATARGRVRRNGRGTRLAPWTYRPPGEYPDDGSGLPPLPPLWGGGNAAD